MAYRYGNFAYIGGGFSKNLHNVLEASAFGLPVIIGPNHHKFPEIAEMIELGAVFTVYNSDEFKIILNKLISDSELYKRASYEAGNFVSSRTGTTRIIFDSISMSFS
ncbi:MAG: glycosyltransferase [Bacteroidia bacterium]|nr:glycosyltransferase [Bacteroidia bacterium]